MDGAKIGSDLVGAGGGKEKAWGRVGRKGSVGGDGTGGDDTGGERRGGVQVSDESAAQVDDGGGGVDGHVAEVRDVLAAVGVGS